MMVIWNNPVGYYSIVVEYENLNDFDGYYVKRGKMIRSDDTEMQMGNIRLIYDDGG